MQKPIIKRTKNTQPADRPPVKADMVPPQRKVRIVSLFSGAGGLEIAACRTGKVEAIVSTDSNATFLSTIEKNLPIHFPEVRHSAIAADVRELKGVTLKHLMGTTPDIVMGGPPCDDYTKFGRKRGFNGDKGPLIFEFLRLVEELKPAVFIFENVPNLVQQFKKGFEIWMARALAIHYYSKWMLLKSCDFGAPTQRARVFVVGWRSPILSQSFAFPCPLYGERNEDDLFIARESTIRPFRHVKEVLADVPDVNTPSAKLFLNHTGRSHRPETVEHMMTVKMGQAVKKSYRYRVPWEGLARSLTAGVDHSTKSYIHPHFHREMSVREYARLHLFPDSWFFSGNHHNGIKQVANSVPIPLGESVLFSVIAHLLNART